VTADGFFNHYDVEELILASSASPRDRMLDIFQKYGISSDERTHVIGIIRDYHHGFNHQGIRYVLVS
jgi:hypothetical protein